MQGDQSTEAGRHFRSRAIGRLYMGPMQQVGYDNRVLELTINDMEFKSSNEADRFMDHIRKKYSSPYGLARSRRLKMISQGDDI